MASDTSYLIFDLFIYCSSFSFYFLSSNEIEITSSNSKVFFSTLSTIFFVFLPTLYRPINGTFLYEKESAVYNRARIAIITIDVIKFNWIEPEWHWITHRQEQWLVVCNVGDEIVALGSSVTVNENERRDMSQEMGSAKSELTQSIVSLGAVVGRPKFSMHTDCDKIIEMDRVAFN